MSFKHFSSTLVALLLMAPLVASAEPVNINTADASALAKALTGIGPAKAKAIISYRDKNGPFKNADQLAMVDGISQKLIDRNRADIRLGNDKGEKAAPDKAAPATPAAKPSPAKSAANPAS
jgi:competence protein ComEA